MKGIIFLRLEEFVEESFGEFAWDSLLNQTDLDSGGAYTSVGFYDDDEFFALVTNLCEQHNLEMVAAQRAFGRWIFARLLAVAPHDMTGYTDTFGFLKAVQNVIHVEVKKIQVDAILPEFLFLEESDKALKMQYVSPRKLCFFCEGLIEALAEHLNEHITVTQAECEHCGDNRCVMLIEKI